MSETPGGFNPSVPVGQGARDAVQVVYKATKAVWAFVVPFSATVALFVKSIADGNLSLSEGLEVLGGLATAFTAAGTVYQIENKPKS